MEILGRENPLALVLNDIFNPTTANMELSTMNLYIQAARDDYYRNLEAQKDFLKEYGSFTSPISKDVENYYAMTTGGLNDLFRFAEDAGIDLIRSQQGRNLIQRYIMSRPYAQLALIKLSAENAKEYQKQYATLASQGLIDPNMAKSIDGDMGSWDTVNGKGLWTALAPMKKTTVEELMAPYVAQLKSQYRRNPKKSTKYVDIYDVDKDRIDATLNDAFKDWENDPRYRYLRDASGLSKQEFERLARESFYGKLGEERKENLEHKARMEEAEKMANIAAKRASVGASNARANYYNKKAEGLNNNEGVSSDWHADKANEGLERLHPELKLGTGATQDVWFGDKANTRQFATFYTKAVSDRLQSDLTKKYKPLFDKAKTKAEKDKVQAMYNAEYKRYVAGKNNNKLYYSRMKREQLPINYASGTMTESEFQHLMSSQNKFSISRKQGDTRTTVSGLAPWSLDSESIKYLGTDYEMQERNIDSAVTRGRRNDYGGLSVPIRDQIAKRFHTTRDKLDFDHASYSISYVGGPNYHRQIQQDGKAHTVVKVMLSINDLKPAEEESLLSIRKYSTDGAMYKEFDNIKDKDDNVKPVKVAVWMDMGEYVPAYDLDGKVKGRTTFNQNNKIRKDNAGINAKSVQVSQSDYLGDEDEEEDN